MYGALPPFERHLQNPLVKLLAWLIGLAWFEVPASLSAMMAAADGLMYEAKQQGHGLKSKEFPKQSGVD